MKLEETHRCPHCKKEYLEKGSLNRHIKIHSKDVKDRKNQSDTDVKCEFCNKDLSSKHALKEHIELTHEKVHIMYSCDICNHQFKRKGHLKRHKLNIHDTEVNCE